MKKLLDAVCLTTKIAYEFDPNDLTDMCRGLVLYDKSTGIVDFIHGTAESLLNNCFSLLTKATTDIVDHRKYFLSDVDKAKTCLTYLSSNVFNHPCANDESLEKGLREYVREIAKTDPNGQDAIFETSDSTAGGNRWAT
jgi:hypothetical protein